MSGARRVVGALVLCALAVGAFGDGSAGAAEGLTAVECVEAPGETGDFATSHCETPANGKKFKTTAFNLNESVAIESTATEISSLSSKIGLSSTVVDCTNATTTGKMTNITPAGEAGEMQIHGTEVVTALSGCMARLASKTTAEEQCKVTSASGEGKVTTAALTAITGPEHKITISEPGGGSLTVFNIVKEGINGKVCNLNAASNVTVKGTLIARINTEKHSHVTFLGEGTLTMGGNAATFTTTAVGHTAAPNQEVTVGATTLSTPEPAH